MPFVQIKMWEGRTQEEKNNIIAKVTEAVEGLIGFRGEQFRQVILLPQGRFRELLTAGAL